MSYKKGSHRNVSVPITNDFYNAFSDKCTSDGVSMAWVVKTLIQQYVDGSLCVDVVTVKTKGIVPRSEQEK